MWCCGRGLFQCGRQMADRAPGDGAGRSGDCARPEIGNGGGWFWPGQERDNYYEYKYRKAFSQDRNGDRRVLAAAAIAGILWTIPSEQRMDGLLGVLTALGVLTIGFGGVYRVALRLEGEDAKMMPGSSHALPLPALRSRPHHGEVRQA